MSLIEDLPSLDERYGRAISSAHLEVLPTRCSVDYLVAAGWCADSIGVKLFRLRSEFDTVRADHQQAKSNLRADTADARALDAKAQAASDSAKSEDDKDIAALRHAEANEAFKEAEATALTARALVLIHLKSLRETSLALQVFAAQLATRKRFMRPDSDVLHIAGRALDLWLDPNCPACDGRGFRGGFREPVVLCTHCDGTGNRERGRRGFRLAQAEASHQFGRTLMADMDRKADNVAQAMRRFLRDGGAAQQSLRPAVVEALRLQLVDLRSAQAQEE